MVDRSCIVVGSARGTFGFAASLIRMLQKRGVIGSVVVGQTCLTLQFAVLLCPSAPLAWLLQDGALDALSCGRDLPHVQFVGLTANPESYLTTTAKGSQRWCHHTRCPRVASVYPVMLAYSLHHQTPQPRQVGAGRAIHIWFPALWT
jgi:hypothetical protein